MMMDIKAYVFIMMLVVSHFCFTNTTCHLFENSNENILGMIIIHVWRCEEKKKCCRQTLIGQTYHNTTMKIRGNMFEHKSESFHHKIKIPLRKHGVLYTRTIVWCLLNTWHPQMIHVPHIITFSYLGWHTNFATNLQIKFLMSHCVHSCKYNLYVFILIPNIYNTNVSLQLEIRCIIMKMVWVES